MKEYYLDSASTTKVKQEVLDAMMPYFTEKYQNPSSLYSDRLKEDIESAKTAVKKHLRVDDDWDVIFTSGGCESNTMMLRSFYTDCLRYSLTPIFVTTNIEHESIRSAYKWLADMWWYELEVDSEGRVSEGELIYTLETAMQKQEEMENSDYIILVSIQYANNELGTIQDIYHLSKVAREYGCFFHTDATQVMKILHPSEHTFEYVDAITFSGHKIGTPKGIGCLCHSSKLPISPMIFGTQMNGKRGGTENVPYIMGLKRAIELLGETKYRFTNPCTKTQLWWELHEQGINVKFNSPNENCIPNILNITFKDNDSIDTQALVLLLSLKKIYTSTGSACHESTRSRKASHVLKAIGLTDADAYSTLRLSWDENLSYEDVVYIVKEIKRGIEMLKDDRYEMES